MPERNDADVLIVGAGPVGLTLAIDLAQRGVSVTLVEMRAAGEPPVGRSNVVSARSMEAFRRLGIARAVREAGLPPDYPHDVAIRTSATGLELGRVKIPCRAERYTAKAARTPGGRRRNRRIASTRSSSSRCCFAPPRRRRACAS